VVDTYNVGDELEGKVTKVVTFGAFVEILDGVEGLVHISELAAHHVENPREIIEPGDVVRVKVLEIDDERRRLSLSTKRVEDQVLPLGGRAPAIIPPEDGTSASDLDDVPELGLSEDVFAEQALAEEAPTEEAAPVEEAPAAEPVPVEEAPAAEAAPPEEPAESASEPEAPVSAPAETVGPPADDDAPAEGADNGQAAGDAEPAEEHAG
jgi:small subunit ribosomal protein S1